jgi:hypothetical protein
MHSIRVSKVVLRKVSEIYVLRTIFSDYEKSNVGVTGSHMVPVLNNIGTDVSCVGVSFVLPWRSTEANLDVEPRP